MSPFEVRGWTLPFIVILAALCAVGCAPAKPVEEPPRSAAACPALPTLEPTTAASSKKAGLPPKPDKKDEPKFTLVLPGNRIAKIPIDVVEQYVDPKATATHTVAPGEAKPTIKHMDDNGDLHIDFEYGECFYDDGTGPKRAVAWHRHPLGTEYAEIYERDRY